MSAVAENRTIELSLIKYSKTKVPVEVPPELRVLGGTEQQPNGWPIFRIIDQEAGDERITWDSSILGDIQAAKKMFVELVKKGLVPYRVGHNGKKTSEVMKEFDPSAEEVIFLPVALVAGG